MPVSIADSQIYGQAWGTDEMRDILDDVPRTQAWLEIISALALAQAELRLIPPEAADEISAKAIVGNVSLDNVRRGYQETSHSTLGLIHEFQRILSPAAGEWVYFGATVQDITDTWTSLVLKQVAQIVYRDLRAIERCLLDLAAQHRDTLMPGRTHGQIGLPITFGFKAAVWAREVRRHIQRLKEAAPRWAVAQLAGGVGSVSSYGDQGLELLRRFSARLGLNAPDISWDTARDNIAEFANISAMVSATLAKIATEIYNLQRPEIGEAAEPFQLDRVGSITMPHKRNPEFSEQIVTLSRVIRYNATLLTEGMLQEHERDARSWKAEWLALPQVCMSLGKSLQLSEQMLGGLTVDEAKMKRNLDSTHGYVLSEAVMLALAKYLGKQTAHQIVYEASMRGVEQGLGMKEALLSDPRAAPYLSGEQIDALLDYRAHVGMIPQMIDHVLELARADRAADPAKLYT